MILVDTSVWIDHLRASEPRLAALLRDNQVMTHPMVIGELACGNLLNRDEVLSLLHGLPAAQVASNGEVLLFVERRRLMGRGIGFIDAHLLVATVLSTAALIWAADRRLTNVATELGLSFA